MLCSDCGNQIPEDSRFCNYCGRTVHDIQKDNSAKDMEPETEGRHGSEAARNSNEKKWWVHSLIHKKTFGPVDSKTLLQWIADERIRSLDLIQRVGSNNWIELGNSEFNKRLLPSRTFKRMVASHPILNGLFLTWFCFWFLLTFFLRRPPSGWDYGSWIIIESVGNLIALGILWLIVLCIVDAIQQPGRIHRHRKKLREELGQESRKEPAFSQWWDSLTPEEQKTYSSETPEHQQWLFAQSPEFRKWFLNLTPEQRNDYLVNKGL